MAMYAWLCMHGCACMAMYGYVCLAMYGYVCMAMYVFIYVYACMVFLKEYVELGKGTHRII